MDDHGWIQRLRKFLDFRKAARCEGNGIKGQEGMDMSESPSAGEKVGRKEERLSIKPVANPGAPLAVAPGRLYAPFHSPTGCTTGIEPSHLLRGFR